MSVINVEIKICSPILFTWLFTTHHHHLTVEPENLLNISVVKSENHARKSVLFIATLVEITISSSITTGG